MPNRSTKVTDQQYQKLYDAVQRDDSAEVEEILKNNGDYLTPASCKGHTSVVELLLSQFEFQPNIRDSMGEPLLSQACASGHTKVAELLIKSGAKLEAKNRSHQTPLLVACSSGHGDTAIMLVNLGANISVVDQERSTPLSLVCRKGLTEVVNLLISKGASVDVEDRNGFVPLGYAIDGGHSDIAVELINAGAMQQMTDTRKTKFFHEACFRGLTPVVELMISKGLADLTDKTNERVLLFACEGGHGDTAVQLINKGAHLDFSDKRGFTPLIKASMKGLGEVVKLLVEKGANMEMETEFGATALSWACENSHSDIAKFLIEAGAKVNVVERSGKTPLLQACSNGLSEVALLLIDKGVRVNGYLGHTPLYMACFNGLTDVVQSLLDHGADMNETTSIGDSMLSVACNHGHRGVAELLIRRGIKNGQTPLFLACRNGHTDIAKLLIENGASMDVEDSEGYSPLYIACENRHSDVAILLINRGANVDVMPPRDRDQILMVAIQNGLSKLALALIEKGVDLDLPNKYQGCTPLYEACKKGLTDVVQSLLDHGADMNETNSKGQTPLLFACLNGHIDIAELLIENGASMDVEDSEGYSPLYIACEYSHSDVAILLLNHGANVDVMPPREGDPILIKAIHRKMSDVVLAMIHKGADVNVKDRMGHDPLYWAKECELHEVVKELSKYSGNSNSTVEQISEPPKKELNRKMIDEYKLKIDNLTQEHKFARTKGIIFVVGIFGPDGTAEDVENITSTFKELKFAVFSERDLTAEKIACLVQAAAECTFPYKYRYIAFYFAGHGGTDESDKPFIRGLQTDASKKELLHIDDFIITPWKVLQLTRLFFFDCCQSAGSGTAFRGDDGGVKKKPKHYPGEVVAFASNRGKKATGNVTRGGVWSYYLCKNLRKPQPITTVLALTFDDVCKVQEDFQKPFFYATVGALVLCEDHQQMVPDQPQAEAEKSPPQEEKIDDQQMVLDQPQAEAEKSPPQKEKIGSPNVIYEKRPQPTHVFKLLKDKSAEWKKIGRALGIPSNERKKFKTSGEDDDDCLENVIEYWLETECYTPVTWSGLLKVLRSDELKYLDIARKLEEFLQTDEARKKYL